MAEPQVSSARLRRAALASIAGTTIEWYDFFLYGAMSALVFNQVFFSSLDPLVGTIAAFSTFAIGFIIRPVGAAVFGAIGDKHGRRSALMLTLVVMGISTVAIGLLPTYGAVGVLAPILLVVLRLGQGFAAGGEWGGAVLLTFENSGGKGRGLKAALPGMGVGLGSLLSTGSVALLTATLSSEELSTWGWRIPFLASAVIVGVGIYIRLAVEETAEFQAHTEDQEQTKVPIQMLVTDYWRQLLVVIGVRMGENGGYYLLGTFGVAYAVHVKADETTVLSAISVAFAVTIVTIPLFGWLSDRLGRRLVYGIGAAVLTVWAWVFFRMIETNAPALIWVAVFIGLIFGYSVMFGAQSAFLAELFDVRVRYSGLALGHGLGAILGGGIAPLVAAALLAVPNVGPMLVSGYGSLMGVITIVALVLSRRLPLGTTTNATKLQETR